VSTDPYTDWVRQYGEPVSIDPSTSAAALAEWRDLLDQRRLWTVIEGEDDDLFIVNGAHVVNRIDYLSTPRAWAEGAMIEVPMDLQPEPSEEADDGMPF
jgi:hypothetical protein